MPRRYKLIPAVFALVSLFLLSGFFSREKDLNSIPNIVTGHWAEVGKMTDYDRKRIEIRPHSMILDGQMKKPKHGMGAIGDVTKYAKGKGGYEVRFYTSRSEYIQLDFNSAGLMSVSEVLFSGERDRVHYHGLFSKFSD
jgi:hypothetical protein